MIRITKVGYGFAAAEVFSQNIKKVTKQEMGADVIQIQEKPTRKFTKELKKEYRL